MIPRDPDAPPVLGTWSRVYSAVLIYLAAAIAALALFAASYSS
jgi:hypothetical protein